MTDVNSANLLNDTWDYPLFEALYGRRSRRFGLGFEIAEGPFSYRSGATTSSIERIRGSFCSWRPASASPAFHYGTAAARRPIAEATGAHSAAPPTAAAPQLFFTNESGLYAIEPAGIWAKQDARDRNG